MKRIEDLFLKLKNADEEEQINLLLNISKKYRNNDNNNALKYAEMAKKLAVKLGRDLYKANALRLINSLSFSQGDYCKFIEFSTEYIEIYKTEKNLKGLCWSLAEMGQCYRKLGDYTKSLNYLNDALKLAQNNDFVQIESTIQNSIALIYIRLEKYKEAESYLKNLLVNQNDGTILYSAYNNLALCAEKQRAYQKAKKYIQKALEYAHILDKKKFAIGSMCNLSSILLAEKKYLEAIKILEDANSHLKNNEFGLNLKIEILNNLGYSYLKTNDLIKAESTIYKSLLLAKKCNEADLIISSLNVIKEIALAKKDFQKAYETLAEIGKLTSNENKKKESLKINLEKLNIKLQAQKQIDGRIAFYKNIMKASTELMAYIDKDYTYIFINDALLHAHNKKRSEILGHSIVEILGESLFNSVIKEKIDLCIGGKNVHHKEWFNYSGIGKRYMSVNYRPHFDENKNISGAIIEAKDITKQKIAEQNLLANEEKFRTIADYTYDWEYWLDKNEKFLYCSPSCKRITGYSPKDFFKNPKLLKDIVHPDDFNILHNHKHGTLKNKDHQLEFRIITKNGKIRWIGHVCQTIFDKKMKTLSIRGSNRDITEKKQGEILLDKERKHFQKIVTSVKDWIWEIDIDGIHTYSNPAVEDILGYKPKEIIGYSVTKFWACVTNIEESNKYLKKKLQSGKGWKNVAGSFLHKNGTKVMTESSATPIYNENKKLIGYRGVDHDITSRLQNEKVLQASEEMLKKAQSLAKIGSWKFDILSKELTWSDETYNIFQFNKSKTKVTYDLFVQIIHPNDRKLMQDSYDKSLKDKIPYNIIHRLLLKDGSIKYVNERCKTFYNKIGEPTLSIGTVQDITKLEKSKQMLKESNHRYRVLAEASYEGVIILKRGVVIEVNKTLLKLTGYTYQECLGRNGLDFIAEESRKNVTKKYKSNYPKPYNAVALRKDGKKIQVEIIGRYFKDNGKLVRITTIRDITKQKLIEKELKDYAKTQEILLREVNHRVKNNLATLISIIHKAQDDAEKKGLNASTVFSVLEERIFSLANVHSLFSKNNWRPVKVSDLCKRIVGNTINNLLPSQQAILKIDDCEILIGSAQAHHLTMVLNELAMNSLKYGFDNKKPLEISIDIKKIGEKYLQLIFQDNGNGFTQQVLNKDFSETGVGFQLINGIVMQSMGGTIYLENNLGARTIIKFELEN